MLLFSLKTQTSEKAEIISAKASSIPARRLQGRMKTTVPAREEHEQRLPRRPRGRRGRDSAAAGEGCAPASPLSPHHGRRSEKTLCSPVQTGLMGPRHSHRKTAPLFFFFPGWIFQKNPRRDWDSYPAVFSQHLSHFLVPAILKKTKRWQSESISPFY